MSPAERYITIGVAGHVDHGKTSLVKALTGIDTDRLKQEKQRGLSIESGIAQFPSENGTSIALVDVPGHTDFIKNTIRGLSCVDSCILVVAADDGVMPQTLEHVQILELNGITDGIIVLSKADLVDSETLELAELEIRDTLQGTFLRDKEILIYSDIDKKNLPAIRDALLKMSEAPRARDTSLPFRMWIDRIRAFRGFGTVVSGTVISGKLSKDAPIELMPGRLITRARALESHHDSVYEAIPGQRLGVNLHRLSMDDVKRGMVLASPDSLRPSRMLNARLRVLKNTAKPIYNRQKVKLYIGTSLVKATVLTMEQDYIRPGEEGFVQLRLSDPAAVLPGDSFIAALMNTPAILGGGKIIEITDRKYRETLKSEVVTSLKALTSMDAVGYIDIRSSCSSTTLIRAEDLAANTGLSLSDLQREIQKKVTRGEFMAFGDKGAIKSEVYKEVKSILPELFREIQEENPMKHSISPEEIKTRLSFSFSIEPLDKILTELFNEGILDKEDGGYLLSGFSPDMSEEQNHAVSMIYDFASESGIAPFCADTVWKKNNRKYPKKKINKVMSFLRSRKRLVKLNDGRYLTADALEQIKDIIRDVVHKKGIFKISDCTPELGYGRSVAIPILEYLDDEGFSVRIEDGRILKEEDLRPNISGQ